MIERKRYEQREGEKDIDKDLGRKGGGGGGNRKNP